MRIWFLFDADADPYADPCYENDADPCGSGSWFPLFYVDPDADPDFILFAADADPDADPGYQNYADPDADPDLHHCSIETNI